MYTVRPVILIAQEFPKPSDIDEDWIIALDLALNSTLIDEFKPGLTVEEKFMFYLNYKRSLALPLLCKTVHVRYLIPTWI
jgi:hypothetical protein